MFSDSSLPRLEEVALDEKKFEVKEYSPLNGNPLVRFSLEINKFHRPTKGISVVGISEWGGENVVVRREDAVEIDFTAVVDIGSVDDKVEDVEWEVVEEDVGDNAVKLEEETVIDGTSVVTAETSIHSFVEVLLGVVLEVATFVVEVDEEDVESVDVLAAKGLSEEVSLQAPVELVILLL